MKTSVKPVVSVLIAGRNDDYQKGWSERFAFVLNYNLRCIAEIGETAAVEFLFVDYCGQTPVFDSVSIDTRGIKVRTCVLQSKSTTPAAFHIPHAFNVGMDMISADLVLVIGADLLLTETGWRNLLSFARQTAGQPSMNDNFVLIPRRQLGKKFDPAHYSYEMFHNFLETASFSNVPFRGMKVSVGAGAGAFLIKKDIFQAVGGFDEDNQGYGGSDVQITSALSVRQDHIDAVNHGFFAVKLPYTSGRRQAQVTKTEGTSSPQHCLSTARTDEYSVELSDVVGKPVVETQEKKTKDHRGEVIRHIKWGLSLRQLFGVARLYVERGFALSTLKPDWPIIHLCAALSVSNVPFHYVFVGRTGSASVAAVGQPAGQGPVHVITSGESHPDPAAYTWLRAIHFSGHYANARSILLNGQNDTEIIGALRHIGPVALFIDSGDALAATIFGSHLVNGADTAVVTISGVVPDHVHVEMTRQKFHRHLVGQATIYMREDAVNAVGTPEPFALFQMLGSLIRGAMVFSTLVLRVARRVKRSFE